MATDPQLLFRIRAGVYNALRHFFFYGPQEDTVRELNGLTTKILDVTENNKVGAVENLENIQEEYTRLVIGPGKVPVSLYETSYRQPEALFMQETTVKLRNLYLESGMMADGIVNLPEDHLAIELEFIYYLAIEALELLGSNDLQQLLQNLDKQREFIQGRTDWIEVMVSRVDEYSQSPGVTAVFHALQNFVQEDLAFISSVIEENQVYSNTNPLLRKTSKQADETMGS